MRELTGESATAQSELDPDGGFLSVGVVRPSGAAINYAVLTRQGTALYARVGTGDFAPSCVLANAIGQTHTLLNVLDGVYLVDTVPTTHAAGARIYFVEGARFFSSTQYLNSDAHGELGAPEPLHRIHRLPKRRPRDIWSKT